MSRPMSYRQACTLIFDDADVIDALVDVVEQSKNWGDFRTRTPAWVLVTLIDAYKALAEQQLGDRIPVVVDDEDAGRCDEP